MDRETPQQESGGAVAASPKQLALFGSNVLERPCADWCHRAAAMPQEKRARNTRIPKQHSGPSWQVLILSFLDVPSTGSAEAASRSWARRIADPTANAWRAHVHRVSLRAARVPHSSGGLEGTPKVDWKARLRALTAQGDDTNCSVSFDDIGRFFVFELEVAAVPKLHGAGTHGDDYDPPLVAARMGPAPGPAFKGSLHLTANTSLALRAGDALRLRVVATRRSDGARAVLYALEAREFVDLSRGNAAIELTPLRSGTGGSMSSVNHRLSPLDMCSECPSSVTAAASRGLGGSSANGSDTCGSFLSEMLDLLVTTRSCAGLGVNRGLGLAATSSTWLQRVELTLLKRTLSRAPRESPLAPPDLAFVLRHLQWV